MKSTISEEFQTKVATAIDVSVSIGSIYFHSNLLFVFFDPIILYLVIQDTDFGTTRYNRIDPISLSDKVAEQEVSLRMLQIDRSLLDKERNKERKRKIPKPGFYPQGFSPYTMISVPCTLALREFRKDISQCSIVHESTSIYFDEAVQDPRQNQPLIVKHPRQNVPQERFSRRKASIAEHLRPRSAAEERRQLNAVLRLSRADLQASMQGTSALPSPPPKPGFNCASTVQQERVIAAAILQGLR